VRFRQDDSAGAISENASVLTLPLKFEWGLEFHNAATEVRGQSGMNGHMRAWLCPQSAAANPIFCRGPIPEAFGYACAGAWDEHPFDGGTLQALDRMRRRIEVL
jgi:hypothetical protein